MVLSRAARASGRRHRRRVLWRLCIVPLSNDVAGGHMGFEATWALDADAAHPGLGRYRVCHLAAQLRTQADTVAQRGLSHSGRRAHTRCAQSGVEFPKITFGRRLLFAKVKMGVRVAMAGTAAIRLAKQGRKVRRFDPPGRSKKRAASIDRLKPSARHATH